MPEAHLQVNCDAVLGTLRLHLHETLQARWTVVFGPSGSGKSSLLRLIAGLWQPPGATVSCQGRELSRVPVHRRRVGLVPQRTSLFPHLTVAENVRFGCPNHAGRSEWVKDVTEAFGLGELLASPIRNLSGGEKQRAELARAIAARPKLLLLDEAFTGLHQELRSELIDKVSIFIAKLDMQVVSVTHDLSEAFACADEVLRLEAGSVVARGAPAAVLDVERRQLLRQMGPA